MQKMSCDICILLLEYLNLFFSANFYVIFDLILKLLSNAKIKQKIFFQILWPSQNTYVNFNDFKFFKTLPVQFHNIFLLDLVCLHNQQPKASYKYLIWDQILRWSTFALRNIIWLLDHVTYIKLRKKNTVIFTQNDIFLSWDPSAIDSYSIDPLSVLHSKLEFEW